MAKHSKPTPRTLERIANLRDPATLDALLDVFQELGMPLGSERWAEHCLILLNQLHEDSLLFNKLLLHVKQATCAMDAVAKNREFQQKYWDLQRKKLS